MTPLTETEITHLKNQVSELKAERETNEEIKKYYRFMVSEFRHQAKTAEDLAQQLYQKASDYEDKLRTL